MSNAGQRTRALVGATFALAVAAWIDTTIMRDAEAQARAVTNIGPVPSLGVLAIAGLMLAATVLGWRSASVAVGVAYVVVGAFFAFLPWIVFTFGSSLNGAPTVLPEPIATLVGDILVATAGPLGAVNLVGAGMAIAGAALLVQTARHRSR